ncbi:MAG TPA: hypothetical protein VFV38_49055 [Ktedonobacteraceae bacterium]|nr:hypothetical protein [Ktedonobacteraceae bacterium]
MASDIRSLMDHIEATYLATRQGLNGLAIVARHDFINKRMQEIDGYHEQLQELVGERALDLVVTALKIADTRYELQQEREARSHAQRKILFP